VTFYPRTLTVIPFFELRGVLHYSFRPKSDLRGWNENSTALNQQPYKTYIRQ